MRTAPTTLSEPENLFITAKDNESRAGLRLEVAQENSQKQRAREAAERTELKRGRPVSATTRATRPMTA